MDIWSNLVLFFKLQLNTISNQTLTLFNLKLIANCQKIQL